MQEYSTTDIDLMVKQANILGRIGRAAKGGLGGAAKGMLMGGALGAAAAPLAGVGLAGALGVGGAGLFSGAMLGGGIRGTVGALRGALKSPGSRRVAQRAMGPGTAGQVYRAGSALPAVALGAGAGYMLSGEDNKMLGTAIGAGAGILARPALAKALARRAGA
jgi:hypothetical protein